MRTISLIFAGTTERKYKAEGEIVFEITPAPAESCPVDLEMKLRAAIKRCDRLNPWKDRDSRTGEEASSFSRLGDGESHYHNVSPPQLHVSFRIVPGIPYLRKGQRDGYELYLNRLAETIFNDREMDGVVKSVRCHFHTATTKKYSLT